MTAKEKVRFGSANGFADLEFENPEEELIRADLAAKVDALLSGLPGTQEEIGRRLGLGQSEVSDLMRGNYGRFSIERLLRILTKLAGRYADGLIGRGRASSSASPPRRTP